MTRCAEDILPASEAHYPTTTADPYATKKGMPENLRHAHDHKDETMERIFIARRFRNDSKSPETLSTHHAKLTTPKPHKT